MKPVARIAVLLAVGLLIVGMICLGSDLIISEVAWAGTAASSTDEWIELQNVSDEAVDLTGWQISFGQALIPLGVAEEDTLEVRTIVLEPGGFLLLERTDDTAVSDIAFNIAYKMALDNAGVLLELRDPQGVVVDFVDGTSTGWPAGTASDGEPAFCTMERRTDGGWASNNGVIRNGLDKDGNPINGTPGKENSVNVLARWAPALELTFPTEEGVILSGTELVSWVASDPDGSDSALAITILVSSNGGEDWSILVENLANTGTFSWDTTAYPSGETYRLLIRASDSEGYFGEAASPVFGIAN